jgi:hypothetical protein
MPYLQGVHNEQTVCLQTSTSFPSDIIQPILITTDTEGLY